MEHAKPFLVALTVCFDIQRQVAQSPFYFTILNSSRDTYIGVKSMECFFTMRCRRLERGQQVNGLTRINGTCSYFQCSVHSISLWFFFIYINVFNLGSQDFGNSTSGQQKRAVLSQNHMLCTPRNIKSVYLKHINFKSNL